MVTIAPIPTIIPIGDYTGNPGDVTTPVSSNILSKYISQHFEA